MMHNQRSAKARENDLADLTGMLIAPFSSAPQLDPVCGKVEVFVGIAASALCSSIGKIASTVTKARAKLDLRGQSLGNLATMRTRNRASGFRRACRRLLAKLPFPLGVTISRTIDLGASQRMNVESFPTHAASAALA